MKSWLPIYLCALTGLLLSCDGQLEDLATVPEIRLRAQYAVPLVDSEVSIRDLIGDGVDEVSLTVDPDGLLRFTYSGDVPEVGAGAAFERLNSLPEGLLLPITANRQNADFPLAADIDLDRVKVASGTFFHNFPNPYDQAVTVTFTIPDATLNGQSFSVSGQLPAHDGEGDPPVFENSANPIPLDGYTIGLPNDAIILEYSIVGEDGTNYEVPERTLSFLQDLRFNFAQGYLGQELYEGERDTIEVSFFDRYLEGNIFFVDPKVIIRLRSTFGLPSRAVIRRFDVIGSNGQVIALEGEGVDNGFDFSFIREAGDTAVTEFVFNRDNSNIDEILAARPVALDYIINASINPEADTTIRGFLTDSSTYDVQVDLELPLFGNAEQFTVRDTVDLNLMDQYASITNVVFRLTTDNGLPVGIGLTGTLLDSLGNEIGTLSEDNTTILQAAPVDGAGRPTGTTREVTDFDFEADRLENLRTAAQLVLTFEITTSDDGSQFIRVEDLQRLRVALGAIVSVAEN